MMEKLGIQGVTPLAPAQREGVVAVIMGVCKQIIEDEAARLVGVAGLDAVAEQS